jgi:hypothetical protein
MPRIPWLNRNPPQQRAVAICRENPPDWKEKTDLQNERQIIANPCV